MYRLYVGGCLQFDLSICVDKVYKGKSCIVLAYCMYTCTCYVSLEVLELNGFHSTAPQISRPV